MSGFVARERKIGPSSLGMNSARLVHSSAKCPLLFLNSLRTFSTKAVPDMCCELSWKNCCRRPTKFSNALLGRRVEQYETNF